jgi:hypothetical protein
MPQLTAAKGGAPAPKRKASGASVVEASANSKAHNRGQSRPGRWLQRQATSQESSTAAEAGIPTAKAGSRNRQAVHNSSVARSAIVTVSKAKGETIDSAVAGRIQLAGLRILRRCKGSG